MVPPFGGFIFGNDVFFVIVTMSHATLNVNFFFACFFSLAMVEFRLLSIARCVSYFFVLFCVSNYLKEKV